MRDTYRGGERERARDRGRGRERATRGVRATQKTTCQVYFQRLSDSGEVGESVCRLPWAANEEHIWARFPPGEMLRRLGEKPQQHASTHTPTKKRTMAGARNVWRWRTIQTKRASGKKRGRERIEAGVGCQPVCCVPPTGRTMRRSCRRGCLNSQLSVRPTVRLSRLRLLRLLRCVFVWSRRGFSGEAAPKYYGED